MYRYASDTESDELYAGVQGNASHSTLFKDRDLIVRVPHSSYF